MKKFLCITSALAFSTLFAGCVVPQQAQPHWYKVGVSEEDAKSAHAQCVYKVGMNKVDAPKENTLIESCMMADGFRWGVPPTYAPAQQEATASDTANDDVKDDVKPKSSKKKTKK